MEEPESYEFKSIELGFTEPVVIAGKTLQTWFFRAPEADDLDVLGAAPMVNDRGDVDTPVAKLWIEHLCGLTAAEVEALSPDVIVGMARLMQPYVDQVSRRGLDPLLVVMRLQKPVRSDDGEAIDRLCFRQPRAADVAELGTAAHSYRRRGPELIATANHALLVSWAARLAGVSIETIRSIGMRDAAALAREMSKTIEYASSVTGRLN